MEMKKFKVGDVVKTNGRWENSELPKGSIGRVEDITEETHIHTLGGVNNNVYKIDWGKESAPTDFSEDFLEPFTPDINVATFKVYKYYDES